MAAPAVVTEVEHRMAHGVHDPALAGNQADQAALAPGLGQIALASAARWAVGDSVTLECSARAPDIGAFEYSITRP